LLNGKILPEYIPPLKVAVSPKVLVELKFVSN
jgi:hypothetical protein